MRANSTGQGRGPLLRHKAPASTLTGPGIPSATPVISSFRFYNPGGAGCVVGISCSPSFRQETGFSNAVKADQAVNPSPQQAEQVLTKMRFREGSSPSFQVKLPQRKRGAAGGPPTIFTFGIRPELRVKVTFVSDRREGEKGAVSGTTITKAE